jgi:hypothetical protein
LAAKRASCIAIESVDHAGEQVWRLLDIDGGGCEGTVDARAVAEPMLRHPGNLSAVNAEIVTSGTIGTRHKSGLRHDLI